MRPIAVRLSCCRILGTSHEPFHVLQESKQSRISYCRPNIGTPTKIPSGGQSKRLQGHFVAQAFQPPDQGPADAVHVDAIKVIRTEFPVVFLTRSEERRVGKEGRSRWSPYH